MDGVSVAVEVLCRIVGEGCLVQETVGAIGKLKGEGRAEGVLLLADRRLLPQCFVVLGAPRDRPRLGFGGESVGGMLVHHEESAEFLLLGEGVAESHAVVEEAEDDVHPNASAVLQADGELGMAVADELLFSPNGLPHRVAGGSVGGEQAHAIRQIDYWTIDRRVGNDGHPQGGREQDSRILAAERVSGFAFGCEREGELEVAVGRGNTLNGFGMRPRQGEKA